MSERKRRTSNGQNFRWDENTRSLCFHLANFRASPNLKNEVSKKLGCSGNALNGMVSNFSRLLKDEKKAANDDVLRVFQNLKDTDREKSISILIEYFDYNITILDLGNSEEDEMFKFANQRYDSIVKRTLDRCIKELFFGFYNSNEYSLDSLSGFSINISDLRNPMEIHASSKIPMEHFYKDMKEVRAFNKAYDKWYTQVMKPQFRNLMKEFRLEFEKILSRYFFVHEYFGTNDNFRSCHYCQISESEIESLYENGCIITKRFYSRGKTMEVDQIEPFKGYTPDNIVLCCYWCNNAKTDEFTYLEFKAVAKEISKVWKDRLAVINSRKAA